MSCMIVGLGGCRSPRQIPKGYVMGISGAFRVDCIV